MYISKYFWVFKLLRLFPPSLIQIVNVCLQWRDLIANNRCTLMERCYYYSDSVNVATEMNALGIKKLVITGCLNPFKCHYLVVCISALTTSQVFGIEKAKKEKLWIPFSKNGNKWWQWNKRYIGTSKVGCFW